MPTHARIKAFLSIISEKVFSFRPLHLWKENVEVIHQQWSRKRIFPHIYIICKQKQLVNILGKTNFILQIDYSNEKIRAVKLLKLTVRNRS